MKDSPAFDMICKTCSTHI